MMRGFLKCYELRNFLREKRSHLVQASAITAPILKLAHFLLLPKKDRGEIAIMNM